VDFSYVEQMFGQSFAFDFSHRLRRTVWTMSYNKSLTNFRIQQLARTTREQTIYGPQDATAIIYDGRKYPVYPQEGVFDENGRQAYTIYHVYDRPSLRDEYYVIETLNTGFTIETRRSNFSVDAHLTKRDYEVQRITGRDIGVDVAWDRVLTSRTSARFALSWQKNRIDEDATEDTRWRLTLGLSRKLTPHTSANLDYHYRSLGSSKGSVGEYQENQVSLTLASRWD
jgi:uncharacterized protein (PEP-CTERM system associated)